MSEIVKVVEVIKPRIRFGRRGDGGGDMCVWVDDFEFVAIHYDYRFTSNSAQWRLAEQIARSLGWTPEDAPTPGATND